jgi:hypothetical protein
MRKKAESGGNYFSSELSLFSLVPSCALGGEFFCSYFKAAPAAMSAASALIL